MHRAGALDEENGIFRDGHAAFFSVEFVVQTDAKDHARIDRREQFGDIGLAIADAVSAEDVAIDDKRGAVGLLSCVVDLAGGVGVADDFHAGRVLRLKARQSE